MPYTYPNNVPRVSKNWDAREKRSCTAAANAVLKRGGSEREAIFACIHAAGKSEKKMTDRKTRTAFFKDRKNGIWFLGIFSNNFTDRQDEIVTEAAHKEYAQWLKDTGVQPPIIMLHMPRFQDVVHYAMLLAVAFNKMSIEQYNANLMELYASTAIAQTKTVIVKNGFSFVIGKVLDSKKAYVEKLMGMWDSWGMSHGFIPLKKNDNIIDQYRTFEFTVAPEVLLANGLTAIGFKEEKMEGKLLEQLKSNLTEEEQAAIEEVFNDEAAETATAKARDILRNLLASKMTAADSNVPDEDKDEEDKEDEEETEEKMSDSDDAYRALAVKLATDFKLKELAQVLNGLGERLLALEEAVKTIPDQIKAVDQSEDERVANQYFKAIENIDWTLGFGTTKTTDSANQDLINQLKSDIPDTIIETAKPDSDNALDLMFWGPMLNS